MHISELRFGRKWQNTGRRNQQKHINVRMSTLDTNDIKIYKDIYANAESALVGFKGKRVDKPGIFYCPM